MSYVVKDICLIGTPSAYTLCSEVFQNLEFGTDFNILSSQTSWMSLIAVTLMDTSASYINIPSRHSQCIGWRGFAVPTNGLTSSPFLYF